MNGYAFSNEVNERQAARGGGLDFVATGFAYPSRVVDNDTFFSECRFPITEDRAALVADTRMRSRRWCAEGENTWTLARAAVDDLLASGAIDASEIDVVLVSSCSTLPGYNAPDPENPVVADLAPKVLAHLGRNDALGIDLKATYCAGFLRCLEVMDGLLSRPDYRAGLIVASDVGGRFATAESNRSAFCFLIGDAAGAVAVRKHRRMDGTGLIDTVGRMDPSRGHLTSWGPDGRSVLVRGAKAQAATLELLIESGRQLFERNRIRPSDVRWFLPMQTHPGALEAVCDALELPRDRLLWTGDVTGYSASASIPARLGSAVREGALRRGDLVLSLAVGAGMNSGGVLFRY